MIYYVTCPCGCGHTFPFEIRRESTEEVAQRRRDNINRIREAYGKNGRPKGIKETKPRKTRCDKGVKKGPRRRDGETEGTF